MKDYKKDKEEEDINSVSDNLEDSSNKNKNKKRSLESAILPPDKRQKTT